MEEAASGVGVSTDWQQVHHELMRLSKNRAGLEYEEGVWLLAAERARTHEHLGYGSVLEYAERLFGHAPRLTQEKLRVAAQLERLPNVALALRRGETTWSAVRELTRVATADTERAWLDSARHKTAREVERLVSGRRPGSLPTDPSDPAAERHILRFEVTGEVLATFRDAMAKIRRNSGGPLDDDQALLLLARQVLAGPTDEGRASYQVALTVCESCARATQTGRGEPVLVSNEVVALAQCDAQVLPSPSSGTPHAADDDDTDPHVGESDHPARATQTVPPALRRAVVRRDHGRCQVPGCTHAHFVDIHHIVARADGGQHEADNLITLCSAHHRSLHRGALRIEGRVSAGLRFLHRDGRPYGAASASGEIGLFSRLSAALRGLGFAERDARRAVAEVQTHAGRDATLEELLREAVQILTARVLVRPTG